MEGAEYNHALGIVEKLMDKDPRSAAESDLMETWAKLIGLYEDERYVIPDAPVEDVIRHLMEQRGLKQVDLVPDVFGSASHASEVINGQREPSKEVARKLSDYFKLPIGIFIKV
jgi:HTH-type transcriptional regulator / antitoxin HigA